MRGACSAGTRSSGSRSTPRRWPKRRRSRLLDYVGIGGVYATTSKDQKKPPIGVDGLRRIVDVFRRREPKFPSCAIAGINAANAGATIAAGADGVSVISALSLATDPTAAARDHARRWSTTRSRRGNGQGEK